MQEAGQVIGLDAGSGMSKPDSIAYLERWTDLPPPRQFILPEEKT